jgi:hypothetical protein
VRAPGPDVGADRGFGCDDGTNAPPVADLSAADSRRSKPDKRSRTSGQQSKACPRQLIQGASGRFEDKEIVRRRARRTPRDAYARETIDPPLLDL